MGLYGNDKNFIDTGRFNFGKYNEEQRGICDFERNKIVITGSRFSDKVISLMPCERNNLDINEQVVYSLTNNKNFIDTSRFDLGASDKIHRAIDDVKADKIIVTGSRCSGKTISLMSYEKNKLNNNEQVIYTLADDNDYNLFLDDDEMAYRYELLLSLRVLDYIKWYYPKLFFTEYKDEYIDVSCKYDEFKKKENLKFKFGVNNYRILLDYKVGSILSSLINKMKQDIRINKVTLIIDRFDWVGNSSTRFQEMAEFFLDLFDRYIITSDDFSLNNYDRRDEFKRKGFEIINVDYGKDFITARNIISRELDYWIKSSWKFRLAYNKVGDISEDTYNKLIERCNGDFGIIYDSIRQLYSLACSDYIGEKDIDNSILKFQRDFLEDRKNYESKLRLKTLHL